MNILWHKKFAYSHSPLLSGLAGSRELEFLAKSNSKLTSLKGQLK